MRYLKIQDIGKVISGSTPKTDVTEYWDGTIPWVTPKEISNLNSQYLNNTERKLTELGFKSCSTNMVPKGSILFTSRAPIGLVAITNIDVCTNQGFKSIVLNEDNYPLYIYYLLRYNGKKLNDLGTGTTFKELSKATFEKFEIPIPPYVDQIKIGTFLSKAEALIKQRKESIDLLDDFLKNIFFKMFGDAISNEKNWSKDYLGNIVAEDCPLTYGIVQPGENYPNGTPVIRPVDLTKSHITREGLKLIDPIISQKFKRTILKGNEILMCVRGTTGVVAYATEELKGCNVTRGIAPIWFDDTYEKLFAYFLFKSNAVQREISKYTYGSTLQQINLSDLRMLNLIRPSIEIQKQFVTIAEKCEEIKNYFDESLLALENLYGSLSQKAFKGELDLSILDIESIIPKSEGGSDAEKIHIQAESKPELKLEIVETYKDKIAKKKKTEITNPKTNWDSVSTQQLANWIKEKYTGFHFSSEMLIRFLMNSYVDFPGYYSSEELKRNPKIDEADSLKSIIFLALSKENSFLELEQIFYNAEAENIQLNIKEEDFEFIKERSLKERSGIYFRIIG